MSRECTRSYMLVAIPNGGPRHVPPLEAVDDGGGRLVIETNIILIQLSFIRSFSSFYLLQKIAQPKEMS